jgi:hypothetical protein
MITEILFYVRPDRASPPRFWLCMCEPEARRQNWKMLAPFASEAEAVAAADLLNKAWRDATLKGS